MEAILKNNRDVWDRLHRDGYHGYRTVDPADTQLHVLTKNLPPGWLGSNKVLLEIGCGVGHWIEELAPMVSEVHGVDISPVAVELGRKRLRHLENVFFYVTRGDELSMFEAETFDLVFSFGCFQHIPRRATAAYLCETYRVLKEKGYLIFQVITMLNPKLNQQDVGFIKRETTLGYTHQQLETLIGASNLHLQAITRQTLTIKARNRAAWLWVNARKLRAGRSHV